MKIQPIYDWELFFVCQNIDNNVLISEPLEEEKVLYGVIAKAKDELYILNTKKERE